MYRHIAYSISYILLGVYIGTRLGLFPFHEYLMVVRFSYVEVHMNSTWHIFKNFVQAQQFQQKEKHFLISIL